MLISSLEMGFRMWVVLFWMVVRASGLA